MKTGQLKPSKSMELKKHVAVIHSSSKISLLQRKIANALLFHAYDNLLIKEEHTIHLSVLTNLIGYDSHDHKRVKQALVDLLSTVIEWNIVDGERVDSEGIWNASALISDASIYGSTCTYSYSNKMRKLLYHPSVYGRVNLEIQSKFQSSYGLALYENCNRYQDIGQTPLLELEKFRRLMGIEEGKYKIFRDLKTRVLDKAVEEVNKYSPLIVKPILKKQNRQVIAIQFLISRSNLNLFKNNDLENKCRIINKLKDQFGLSLEQAISVKERYEENYIDEKMRLIKVSDSYSSGKIKNLAKYLLSALEENYQLPKDSKFKLMGSDVKKQNENYQAEYERYQNQTLFKCFNNLSDKKKDKIICDFNEYISKTLYDSLYKKDGLSNILIKDQLIKFLKINFKEGMSSLVAFEEWSKIRHLMPSENIDF